MDLLPTFSNLQEVIDKVICIFPSFFILGTELMSRLLLIAKQLGKIQGFKMSSTRLSVSHLKFADDLLIL